MFIKPAQRRQRLRRAVPPELDTGLASFLSSRLPTWRRSVLASPSETRKPAAARSAGGITSTAGAMCSTVAFLTYVACTTLVVGAKVPTLPTCSKEEVARPTAPATASVAATTDAFPVPSRGPVKVPATPSLLLKVSARLLGGVIVRGPSPSATAAVARRRGPSWPVAAIAATRPSTSRAPSTARAARVVQRAETVALVVASALTTTGVR